MGRETSRQSKKRTNVINCASFLVFILEKDFSLSSGWLPIARRCDNNNKSVRNNEMTKCTSWVVKSISFFLILSHGFRRKIFCRPRLFRSVNRRVRPIWDPGRQMRINKSKPLLQKSGFSSSSSTAALSFSSASVHLPSNQLDSGGSWSKSDQAWSWRKLGSKQKDHPSSRTNSNWMIREREKQLNNMGRENAFVSIEWKKTIRYFVTGREKKTTFSFYVSRIPDDVASSARYKWSHLSNDISLR